MYFVGKRTSDYSDVEYGVEGGSSFGAEVIKETENMEKKSNNLQEQKLLPGWRARWGRK